MDFTEFKKALQDYYLDSDFEEINSLLLDWVQREVADPDIQNQVFPHARKVRNVLKRNRQGMFTSEEFDVEINVWWDNLSEYLRAIGEYLEELKQKSAADHSLPELVNKVRRALEDLNFKKEIRLFRRFQSDVGRNRGVFMINGSQYYGQNWLYLLLLKLLGQRAGDHQVREVPIDFSGVTPINLFLFELQDHFGLTERGDEAANKEALMDTILNLWEQNETIIFRIEMNGQIPPPALLHFLSTFWHPLYERSRQRQSKHYLLLFLIFGHTFSLPEADPAGHQLVLSRDMTDDWVPLHPLLMDIQLLDLEEVVRWLDGRIIEFDDLVDPEAVARDLMQNQDTSFPEIVMMSFCKRYDLSFRNDILMR